uniref:Serpin family D member 1 n=1 Tax=Sphenodon punctatus TaxID=8508 RepID=A0A8D0HHQ1_SPHPU
MKFLFCTAILSLIITSAFCGIKDIHEHFDRINEAKSTYPSWAPNGTNGMPHLPPEFHKENTVTNDLIVEEEEEEEETEDYLDLDYYFDIVDAVPEAIFEFRQGNVIDLFQGKSRIQRLNTLNANFAFNLYQSLKDKANSSENILLAPVGISTAMAMISLGLKGQTHEELFSVLGFRDFINASSKYDVMTVHNLFHKLTNRLFKHNFGYTLRSVNDLYIQQQFPILDEFKNNMKKYYFADARSTDFTDPAFITKTNEHVLKLTKGLIKEALAYVNPTTLIMILNCIYFKGTWVNKFPVEATYKQTFRLNEKETVKVPMMRTKSNFLAAADHELDCDVLQLPYVGNISMLIVLPHKLSGMNILEKQLTPQVVERWLKSMTNRTREVALPKFKLQKTYHLIDSLKSLGISNLFNQSSDYSGISNKEIIINTFEHQSTITVNEEGTEAAAVTNVGFMPLSTQNRFVADRPFIFLIYEHRTNCLLFMGRVANPSKS